MTKDHGLAAKGLTSIRGAGVGFLLGLGVAGAVACSTTTKKEPARSALDAMPREQRLDTFEATSRVLDEHPEYVDELYAAARRHPRLLDRFLMNAAKDLKDRHRAEMAAKHLVADPDSLEQALVTTMDFIARVPAARAAMNRAVVSRAEEATEIMASDPATVSRVLEAALLVMEKKPQARRSALAAVEANRARILTFVKNDPGLTKQLGEELLREAVKDKPGLEKALRAAKVFDDDHAAPPAPER
jgi:hypothetical protein